MKPSRLLFLGVWSAACLALGATIAAGQEPRGKKPKGGRAGEVITPAAKGERIQTNLKVGDAAPGFSLPRLKTEGEVKLSSFKNKKPVVLIFGSYT